MNIIDRIGNKQIEKVLGQRQLPEFAPGDTVRVDVKVIEGTRERIQAFEGVCIARKSDGVNSSFTVRKISYGEGVERVFPTHAPQVVQDHKTSNEIAFSCGLLPTIFSEAASVPIFASA